MQKRKSQSSTGTTPMKIPRSVEKSKGVRELNKIDGANRVEDQEVLEIHTNLEDENFVNDQNQTVQQKEH